MKIIHFSDTHLGFSDYTKVDTKTGINLRESDVYAAFSQVVKYIKDNPPDAVIHSGDLFDTARPSNRAINFAVKKISELDKIGIPLIFISGNHSTPRIKSSGSIFEIFEVFDNVYPVYQAKYKKLIIKDVAFHCIPHMPSEEEIKSVFEKIIPDPQAKYNIIISHFGITAGSQYKMGEFNELIIPIDSLKKNESNFDYIAMGHYHKNIALTNNAYYSGSTERFSFREEGYKKGFMYINLDKLEFKFIPITTREIVTFDPIDCKGKTAKGIEEAIVFLTKGNIKDKIIQITFSNIKRFQYAELDIRNLKNITSEAVYVKWVHNWATEEKHKSCSNTIGSLSTEFETFINKYSIDDLGKERLKELGLKYLSAALGLEGI